MNEGPPLPSADGVAAHVASSRAGLRPGDRVGPYRLVRLIGEGAGGSVYEVVHEKLGRRAALKLLAAAQAARPAARARFHAEALSVNRIASPHIVEITDVVETAEHAALVMELLEGQSLREAMSAPAPAAPLAPEHFLPILSQVCAALAAAHAAGFVHRDLKPENVFLCARGGSAHFVKLLDFGVAIAASPPTRGAGADETPSRRPATFVGTPAYASPEQASGGRVDDTTDIYAVGVMLYELVCGRLPFEGWSAGQFVIQHLSAPVPRLPADLRATPLGRALDAVVQGCMAKNPADRFSSAAELAATLAALGRGEIVPVSTRVPRLVPRRLRWPRRTTLAGLAAVLGLGLVIALAARRSGEHVDAWRPDTTASGAAAAVPAAAPVQAPVVAISFESQPPGAEVRAVDDGELLGLTPFRRAFPRGGAERVVEIARAGYEPVRLSLSTATSRALSVELVRKERRRHHRRLSSEKTIDPFRHFSR